MITNRIIQQLLKLAKPDNEDDDLYGFNDDNEEINDSFSFSNDDEDNISFDFDDNKQEQTSDNNTNNAIEDVFSDSTTTKENNINNNSNKDAFSNDTFSNDTFNEDAFSEDAFNENTMEKKQEIQQAVLKADAPLESWTDTINTKEQLVKAVHSIYKDNLETLPKHIFNVFIK